MKSTKNKTALVMLPALALATSAPAALVTGWELIFDGDVDSSITGGSGATASPVIDSLRRTSIAANFATVSLADGDSISLTGTVSFSVVLAGNQFRFGLFDGDNPVVAGDGVGYEGFYAEAPISGGGTNIIKSTDGTGTPHPFSSGSATVLGDLPDPAVTPVADTSLDFTLTLTRAGSAVDLFASITDGGTYSTSDTLTGLSAVPGSLSYDSVAFLMGGSFADPGTATFSNIDVTYTAVPEPSSAALLGLGGLALVFRRRK